MKYIEQRRQAIDAGVCTDLQQLLQYRHIAKDLNLFVRRKTKQQLMGNAPSNFRGRGMEFEEVRLYQAGDDIRSIDWRVTARTGKTHTKLFREERERPVHIVTDLRNTMFFGSKQRFKSVLAADISCLIAWAALGGSDRVGGQILAHEQEIDIRARRSKTAVLNFIHALQDSNESLVKHHTQETAESSNTGQKSIAELLDECRRMTRPGTAVFIVSDFHDFDTLAQKALSLLGRHTDVTLFNVRDPLEQPDINRNNFPLSGLLNISNGHSIETIAFNRSTLDRWQTTHQTQQQLLQQAALGAKARLLHVNTDDDPVLFLKQFYS